jgi:hypothetical protein
MKRTNWKGYIVELVVVFIGITGAFLLNNWRENAKDIQLEMKYLHTLSSEVTGDTANLEAGIEDKELKLEKIRKYIMHIKSGSATIDSAAVLVSTILSISTFGINSSTYESMKYNGTLNLIRNFELRQKIVNYYESFEGYADQRQISIDFMYDYVAKFAIENMDFTKNNTIVTPDVKLSYVNNIILSYYSFLSSNLQRQNIIYELNKELKSMLEEYLNI